jgi:hypothetical protein
MALAVVMGLLKGVLKGVRRAISRVTRWAPPRLQPWWLNGRLTNLGQTTHVGQQRLRHGHAAIGVLVILQHRHQRAAHG